MRKGLAPIIAIPLVIVVIAVLGYLYANNAIPQSGVPSNCVVVNTVYGPSGAANFFYYTCPTSISVSQCQWEFSTSCSNVLLNGGSTSFTGTLTTQSQVKFSCSQATSPWITIREINCNPCGDGILQSNEICDTSINNGIRYQTVSTIQNGCVGTKQQKSTCLSDCSGWTGWSDVPGSFVQTDKCCGVSCSPTTAQCNSFCSGSQWCVYSSSVVSCTPTCNPSTGLCGSCQAACGTPSCSLTKGQCGVSCSSDADCTIKTTPCPEKCDESYPRKYVSAVPSQTCYPNCVNGACTDCTSICPYASGSYVIGKCGANCVSDQSCGDCGVNKCVDGILQGCQPQQNLCGSGYVCQ